MPMEIIRSIQNRIYEIRDERVMLDFDVASMYEVETKALNQAVKRNIERFPDDFMFRLSNSEWEGMRSQFVTLHPKMRSQIVTTSKKVAEVIDFKNQNKRNLMVLP